MARKKSWQKIILMARTTFMSACLKARQARRDRRSFPALQHENPARFAWGRFFPG